MAQQSGIEALLEALRRSSGFDFTSAAPADFTVEDATEDANTSGENARRSSKGGNGGRGGFGGSGIPHVEIPFVDKMRSMGKRAIVIGIILLIIILLAAYWWFHPPINIHSVDTWMFVAIFVLLPTYLVLSTRSKNYSVGTSKVEQNESKAKTFKFASYIPVAIALVGVLGAVASLSFFPGNAEKYANVLQTETNDFTEDIQQVDYSEIPIIDRSSAILLGNREMGSIPEYVSQFEVSSLYSQINYQSKPVRVSPLLYADLFKWWTNREAGIPAYAMVDMTTQEAQIVRLDGNPIHYSESEPLVRNIDRHVQLKYPFYMFDEKSFEIDDNGQPWWICPVQERTIGLFGGTTISRVVLCNATTGECQDLAIEDCPQWVDRAYPAELLIQQYNWSGAYKNGWLNSFLGQEGVVQTTPGTNDQVGYNYIAKDDDVWVYTGVTSATADNSIVGFVLINQRTAESHYYEISGATETSAMGSAEGQVQNLRYTSTFPLLINVADRPTYFMALKDGAGLVKMFAMVDIQSYQNVATGSTVAACQEAYLELLASNGIETATEAIETVSAQGIISVMTQAVVGGNSHFYVTLEKDDNVYDFALPDLMDIVRFQPGDTIKFAYVDDGETGAKVVQRFEGIETYDYDVADAAPAGDGTTDAAAGDAAGTTGTV